MVRRGIAKAYDADKQMLLRLSLSSIFNVQKLQSYIIIIDVSYSMKDDLQYMKDILARWIQTVPEGSVLTLIQFSDNAYFICENKVVDEQNRNELIRTINDLQVMGSTNIQAGIQTALYAQTNDKSHFPHRIVFLSDGVANAGETNVSELAKMMKKFPKIDVVMLSENSSATFTEEVKKLQDNTTAHFAANGEELHTVFSNVFKSFNRHPVVVRVGDKTKIVPDYVQMSEIDLIFDIDCSSNPIISLSVKIGDTEEIIYEGSFSDIRTDIQPEKLVQLLGIAEDLKTVNQVKTEIIVKKDETDFKRAAETLQPITDKMFKMTLKITDIADAPIYRSLCDQLKETNNIVEKYNAKDPGECPVTFETVEVEVQTTGAAAFRSLGSCTTLKQVFRSDEEEEMYKKWVQDKQVFNSKRCVSQHEFVALKEICM